MAFPVTAERSLKLEQPAEAERFLLVNFQGGATIYYGSSPSVSASSNEGSIAPGGSAEFSTPRYIISAGRSVADLVALHEPVTGLTSQRLATQAELQAAGGATTAALATETAARKAADAVGLADLLMTPSMKVPARAQRTVIQQFQAGHGYEKFAGTGTFSDDIVDFVVGTQSIKIATLEDESQTKVRKKTVGPYNFVGKDLRVTFKIEGLANIGVCEIYLSSDNLATNNVHYRLSSGAQPYIADGEWATITIPWGDLANASPAGSINREAVNFIEFRFEAQLGKTATLHINEVAAVPTQAAGVVSLVFDDGWESTYTKARPYLDKYGYRGTCCLIGNLIGTPSYLSLAQAKGLQHPSGWDICAHAFTVANHNAGFGTLEDSVVQGELEGIKNLLIENGFKRRDLFMWPKGSFTASQMIMARKYFNAIRGTTGGKGGNGGAHETFPPGENGRLRSFLCGGSTNTAAEVETALTECSTYKTWLILTFHQIVTSGAASGTECNESVFKEMIDKVAASGLAVKTVAEVLES